MDFHNILVMASEQQGLNAVPVSSGAVGAAGGRGAGARRRSGPGRAPRPREPLLPRPLLGSARRCPCRAFRLAGRGCSLLGAGKASVGGEGASGAPSVNRCRLPGLGAGSRGLPACSGGAGIPPGAEPCCGGRQCPKAGSVLLFGLRTRVCHVSSASRRQSDKFRVNGLRCLRSLCAPRRNKV